MRLSNLPPGVTDKMIEDNANGADNARAVRIVHNEKFKAYFVEYAERKKGTRYCAARFDARDKTLEQVTQWVNDQEKLILIDFD